MKKLLSALFLSVFSVVSAVNVNPADTQSIFKQCVGVVAKNAQNGWGTYDYKLPSGYDVFFDMPSVPVPTQWDEDDSWTWVGSNDPNYIYTLSFEFSDSSSAADDSSSTTPEGQVTDLLNIFEELGYQILFFQTTTTSQGYPAADLYVSNPSDNTQFKIRIVQLPDGTSIILKAYSTDGNDDFADFINSVNIQSPPSA